MYCVHKEGENTEGQRMVYIPNFFSPSSAPLTRYKPYCFYIYIYVRLLTYFIKNPQDCHSQNCHPVLIRKRSPLGRDSPVDIWLDKQRNFCEKKVDWGSWLGEQSMGCVSAPLTSQQGTLVQTTTHTPACGTLNPRVLTGHLAI